MAKGLPFSLLICSRGLTEDLAPSTQADGTGEGVDADLCIALHLRY